MPATVTLPVRVTICITTERVPMIQTWVRIIWTMGRVKGYIDHVRQDGKIDITLQPSGRQQTLDFAEVLLRYLYENNGFCNLGDKSPAEMIYDRFQVSKKAYKKAIGDLYRRRLIIIDDEGIKLV